MPFNDLKAHIYRLYRPAIALRNVITKERRVHYEHMLAIVSAALFMLALLAFAIQYGTLGDLPGVDYVGMFSYKIYGLFLIVLSVAFVFTALEAMHRSQYFHGLDQVLAEASDPLHVPVSWEVASIVVDTPAHDITLGFLDSTFGQEILYRAGISSEAYEYFYTHRTPQLTGDAFIIDRHGGVVLATYAKSLCKNDPDFVQFLADNGVSAAHFVEAARWVTRIERGERRRARWWSRDNLGRIPGVGKTWGYGETYLLERYGHDLTEDHVWPSAVMTRHREEDEVEQMEAVLSRARQSNVMVVGSDLLNVRQKVAQLYHKIREGEALPPLEGRRVFLIDLEVIVSAHPDKADFEEALRKVFDQAVAAGNIVLYFEYFAVAVSSAHTIGVDIVDIILPYLQSDRVQLVAAATKDGFFSRLQQDSRLMQAFDVIQTQDVSKSALLAILEQRALELERKTKVTTTIPALDSIAKVADQYFPTGVMPDKAFDLLEEVIPAVMTHGKDVVLESDVHELVTRKTGVPVGTPTTEERDRLLTLEQVLHRRVVGQDHAVDAVAKAIRRNRAGVEGNDRPIGSFLFLGPTGVGKTETAKALAEVMFGDQNAMTRLDMSEFQGADALERMIGNYDLGKPGILASLIREKQYGVLLLDEFEKSDVHVHDLFLQVLDEGKFTDASGNVVNARNLIIIATSNAGADLLWKWEEEKKDLSQQKKVLIDELISRGLFRPEFLNRFDDVVMFHVLQPEQVRGIARNQLAILQKRLRDEQRIDVSFDDSLVEKVAELGYDPKFGGRSMRRVIQEHVEQLIADLIIKGDIQPGTHVTLQGKNLKA